MHFSQFFQRNRVSIIFFIFSLGLVFSYIVIDEFVYKNIETRAVIDTAPGVMEQKEKLISRFVRDQKSVLTSLGSSSYFQDYLHNNQSQQKLETLMQTVLRANRDLLSVAFLDKEAKERMSVSYGERNKTLNEESLRDFFKQFQPNKQEQIEFFKIEDNSIKALMPVVVEKELQGGFVLEVSLNNFLEQLYHVGVFDIILATQEGRVIKSTLKGAQDLAIIFPKEHQKILQHKHIASSTFVAKHLDFGLSDDFVLILKIKEETIEKYAELNREKGIIVSLVILALSAIMSQLVSSFVAKLTQENERVKQAEERFKLAARTSKELIYELDLKTNKLTWFGDDEVVLGYNKNRQKLTPEFLLARVHKDDRALVQANIDPQLRKDLQSEITYKIRNKEEHWVYFHDFSEMLLDAQGNPEKIIGTCTDITKRLLNQKKLKQSANVFENTNEGVLITDKEGVILDTNRAFTEITGFTKKEVLGKRPSILKSGIYEPKFYAAMWADLLSKRKWIGEIYNRRKDGSMYPELLNISAVVDENKDIENFIAVFSDISVLRESEQKLDFLSHHDSLTGLPNKTLLKARIEQAIYGNHRRLKSVIFLDIDNFKNINDSFGHSIGDEMLVEISKRLAKHTKKSDTLARIGGDDFIVFLDNVQDLDYISFYADKILRLINEPIKLGEQKFRITGSIGISLFPNDGEGSEDLIKNADTAMFRSKDNGKNTFVFYDNDMSKTTYEKVTLENEIQSALDSDEIEVFYQPQFDLTSEKVIGFEALARWFHPNLGFVPPDKFIPVAEETKMIIPIGAYILRKACEDMATLEQEGLAPGRVAVNVSGVQIEDSNFIQTIKESLADSKISVDMLEIEITESMMMKFPDTWIDLLTDIRKVGIGISLDDFGTGYSSLNHLKKLPITTLKIDRSFIMDIPHDANACAVAKAIIGLGKSMGMKTLAEGIEEESQKVYLQELGCTEAQGYYYAKPMSLKDARIFLQGGEDG